MENRLSTILESYPVKVNCTDVVDFDKFDERLSAADCLVANTIGVTEGYIEFIHNNDPPLKEEILCWIWAIRPDLSKELIKLDISNDFKVLLESHINNNMQKFWDYISQSE